jgi:hypothetical protein
VVEEHTLPKRGFFATLFCLPPERPLGSALKDNKGGLKLKRIKTILIHFHGGGFVAMSTATH